MPIKGEMKIESIANFWLNEVRPPLDKALESTPENKFEWRPAPDMITLGNIFMHISETSEWWIDKVIDGKSFKDLTPCPCPSKSEIAGLLTSHWQRLELFFARAPKILDDKYDYNGRGELVKLSGTWIMLHLLEHDIHHRSQINHYLRILGIKPPPI